MTSRASSGSGVAARRGGAPADEIDWVAAERSPEFRELIAKRRGFVLPATVFFLAWYLGFITLSGYAPGFMGSSVYQGLTIGYLLALTQFVMVWVLGAIYLRRSARTFDPLARQAASTAVEAGRRARGTAQGGGSPGGRREGGVRPS